MTNRLGSFWDKAQDSIKGILGALLVLALVIILIQSFQARDSAADAKTLAQQNLTSQTNHHATSVKQQNEIIKLVTEVHDAQVVNKGTLTDLANLESEVATVIEGLPAADKTLAAEAEGLAQDLMALCASTGADCQPLPSP